MERDEMDISQKSAALVSLLFLLKLYLAIVVSLLSIFIVVLPLITLSVETWPASFTLQTCMHIT
jgi:hypothetical protein